MTESLSEEDLLNLVDSISTNEQGEVFDQDDVLNLVNKVVSNDNLTEEGTDEDESSRVSDLKLASKTYNVKIYDFKGPDKFSKDQLRTIQMIHENFSRTTATFLSGYLRKSVSINLSSVDQITYEQFVKAVSNPSTLAIIDMSPFNNSMILELSPTISFVIIDRIFGGDGDILKYMRELSDIELSVINSLVVRLLSGLREAWSGVMDVRPRLEKIESDIQFIQIVPYNDTVILVSFDVQIGEIDGTMMFCIPYIALDSVMSKLSAKSIYGTYKQDRVEEKNNIFKHVLNLPLDVTLSMGKINLDMEQVLALKEGDFISLNKKKNDFFDIIVGDDVKFKGIAGKQGKKMVSKIMSIKRESKGRGGAENSNFDEDLGEDL